MKKVREEEGVKHVAKRSTFLLIAILAVVILAEVVVTQVRRRIL